MPENCWDFSVDVCLSFGISFEFSSNSKSFGISAETGYMKFYLKFYFLLNHQTILLFAIFEGVLEVSFKSLVDILGWSRFFDYICHVNFYL